MKGFTGYFILAIGNSDFLILERNFMFHNHSQGRIIMYNINYEVGICAFNSFINKMTKMSHDKI